MGPPIEIRLRSVMVEPKMGNWIENDRDESKNFFTLHADCIRIEGHATLLSLIRESRKRGTCHNLTRIFG